MRQLQAAELVVARGDRLPAIESACGAIDRDERLCHWEVLLQLHLDFNM